MMYLSPKTSRKILKELCRCVGVDFESVDFQKKDWYHDHEWTEAEEEAFIDWLADQLIAERPKLLLLHGARHEAEKLVASYGWKTKL